MGKFSQPARTVRDIKTLAGKSEDLLTPHKMYMRLFALETERHRRQQERASAMQRVTNIDIRCTEIDQEEQELLRLLGIESLPAEAPEADTPTAGRPAAAASRAVMRPRALRGSAPTRANRPTASAPAEAPVFETVKIRY